MTGLEVLDMGGWLLGFWIVQMSRFRVHSLEDDSKRGIIWGGNVSCISFGHFLFIWGALQITKLNDRWTRYWVSTVSGSKLSLCSFKPHPFIKSCLNLPPPGDATAPLFPHWSSSHLCSILGLLAWPTHRAPATYSTMCMLICLVSTIRNWDFWYQGPCESRLSLTTSTSYT